MIIYQNKGMIIKYLNNYWIYCNFINFSKGVLEKIKAILLNLSI